MLAAAAALEHSHTPKPVSEIPLTRNEIAHLLATVIIRPADDPSHRLHWSRWRRRHQHRPDLPLPAASSPRRGNLTVHGWNARHLVCIAAPWGCRAQGVTIWT